MADVVETAVAETPSREETTTEGTEDPRDKTVAAEADLQSKDVRRDVALEVTAVEDDHLSTTSSE